MTIHAATPVTLHVSSIGNGVRPGRYVTLLGPSIIVPVFVYVHDCLYNQNMVHAYMICVHIIEIQCNTQIMLKG